MLLLMKKPPNYLSYCGKQTFFWWLYIAEYLDVFLAFKVTTPQILGLTKLKSLNINKFIY
jgi:hypothetical protein